jgi:uncharacterized membrane protein YeaQ/YmgE (transglycosylase-associated protein family)
MFWIIGMLIVGLVAGAVARLLVPGRDPMGLAGTLLLGLVGSRIGGRRGFLIFGADIEDGAVQTAGVFGSIVGAVIALLAWRAFQNRREGGPHAVH